MKQPKVNFYNLAWRWHFYAGLFVAPFMVMLALTGTIYLFKPQLDSLMYSSLLNVPAGHHKRRSTMRRRDVAVEGCKPVRMLEGRGPRLAEKAVVFHRTGIETVGRLELD